MHVNRAALSSVCKHRRLVLGAANLAPFSTSLKNSVIVYSEHSEGFLGLMHMISECIAQDFQIAD